MFLLIESKTKDKMKNNKKKKEEKPKQNKNENILQKTIQYSPGRGHEWGHNTIFYFKGSTNECFIAWTCLSFAVEAQRICRYCST